MATTLNIPHNHTVEVKTPGETVTDMYGNELPGNGEWVQVKAASWWIDRTEEKNQDSVLRTLDYLHVHVEDTAAATAASMVRLPDGTEWEVLGNPENYRHGWHGFDPKLLVIHARKVEG